MTKAIPLLMMFLICEHRDSHRFTRAGLMYGQRCDLVTAEYWRWWVVHLWVEGFFEVFATVVIAFLFTRLKLLSVESTTRAVLFSTVIFLSGGIIGTFHHLYFAGTPTSVSGDWRGLQRPGGCAAGAGWLRSVGEHSPALEPARTAPWLGAYKWPVYFFVAVAFWNLVGAGLFGFLINPPIALYYVQGLNTTPAHGHAALFGVYGMLGSGTDAVLSPRTQARRGLEGEAARACFLVLNIGLAAMVLLSILPVGLIQAWASVDRGTWYARSSEFLHGPYMTPLKWMRVPGDILFSVGALVLAYFIVGLVAGYSFDTERSYEREFAEEEALKAEACLAD